MKKKLLAVLFFVCVPAIILSPAHFFWRGLLVSLATPYGLWVRSLSWPFRVTSSCLLCTTALLPVLALCCLLACHSRHFVNQCAILQHAGGPPHQEELQQVQMQRTCLWKWQTRIQTFMQQVQQIVLSKMCYI